MCIRDSIWPDTLGFLHHPEAGIQQVTSTVLWVCLLYTSDAADDLTRVDLGGRRFFQAEDGRRDLVRSRGLGDVYKRQHLAGHPGFPAPPGGGHPTGDVHGVVG